MENGAKAKRVGEKEREEGRERLEGEEGEGRERGAYQS
jgi:hypothetical protein